MFSGSGANARYQFSHLCVGFSAQSGYVRVFAGHFDGGIGSSTKIYRDVRPLNGLHC